MPSPPLAKLPPTAFGRHASSGLPIDWTALSAFLNRQTRNRLGPTRPIATGDRTKREHSQLALMAEPYQRLRKRLLDAPYLQLVSLPSPKTTAAVHRARQGYDLITGPGEDVAVVPWARKRHGGPRLWLSGFTGYLHLTDVPKAAGWLDLLPAIKPVACWGTVRQSLVAGHADWPKAARVLLRLIDGLLSLDEEAETNQATAAVRKTSRRQWLFRVDWVRRIAQGVTERRPQSSNLRLACERMLRDWEPLRRHFETGDTRLIHHLAEEAIRFETFAAPRRRRTPDNATAAMVYSYALSHLRGSVALTYGYNVPR